MPAGMYDRGRVRSIVKPGVFGKPDACSVIIVRTWRIIYAYSKTTKVMLCYSFLSVIQMVGLLVCFF